MRFTPDALAHPIVQAPLAGGPSTPGARRRGLRRGRPGLPRRGLQDRRGGAGRPRRAALAAAGRRPVRRQPLRAARAGAGAARGRRVRRRRSRAEAERARRAPRRAALGRRPLRRQARPRLRERVAVVSFTFGCPSAGDVRRLQDAGAAVWVTVTTADEARARPCRRRRRADRAGRRGGRSSRPFDDARPGDVGLLALLQLVRGAVGDATPLIATGVSRRVAASRRCSPPVRRPRSSARRSCSAPRRRRRPRTAPRSRTAARTPR